jgi:chromosome segregation ATPase
VTSCNRLETETKQLHQIIKQLRQAVKPVSGDKNEVQSRNIQLAMEKQAQELKQEQEKESNTAKQEFEAEVDLLKRNHEGETSRLYNKLTELQSLCSKEVKDHEETAKKLILVQEQFELFRKSQHDVSSPVHVQNGSVNTTVHQEAELASLQVMVETREYENKALAEKLAQCQQQIIALEDSEKTDQQDVMIKQLEGDVAVLREQLQACQDERQAVNQKLSTLQTSDKSSGQALTELKAQNQK